jgi:hypothetical protein
LHAHSQISIRLIERIQMFWLASQEHEQYWAISGVEVLAQFEEDQIEPLLRLSLSGHGV